MKTFATLLLSLCATVVAPAQPTASSLLLTKEGKVEFARAGQAAWNAGTTNQTLANGDRVRTGSRSRATIRLSDASVLVVKELTTLEIRPPQTAGANSGFDVKSGSSYFFNRERPGTVEFRTPLASGAIRGTEFHITVAENGRTEIALFDGTVELTNDFGGASLTSNEQAVIDPGQAPRKTAMLEASSIIQWVLYYPAVLDANELGLSDAEKSALTDSLAAYRTGDLLAAQESYPANRTPGSDAEKTYRAATLIAVGQVDEANALLQNLSTPSAEALRQMIATVKGQPASRGTALTQAGEWMAESYALQAQSKLESALEAARKATAKSPDFGFAWARVAELEFSFSRAAAAQAALEKALVLSPRHAQAHALAGFTHAAQGRIKAAEQSFENAIALDPGLANGWLGRGLIRIRQGRGVEGRQDLQVAAAREPQRSMLRSYLGKAWSQTRHTALAEKELGLAKKFDPNDPTPWLYSAILDEQQNRVNEAIGDLEKSQELNDNRSVFRSRLLLDQDQAVRSANLARIYQDAGLTDWSVREASRAVSYDYANFSAHQFLANSYEALRDPRASNLRYEAPAVSEYFIASLLSPVGATPLSQSVSQQEYTRLFDRDHFGLASSTEYFSNGDWVQQGSQYGRMGPVDYSLDAYYRTEKGFRRNDDVERMDFAGKFRAQLTPKDTIYFEAQRTEYEAGDVGQRYSQTDVNRSLRIEEVQNPNLFLGYHREWAPGSHTLALGGRLRDVFRVTNRNEFIRDYNILPDGSPSTTTPVQELRWGTDLHNDIEGYIAELQQILKVGSHTFVVGGRFQTLESEVRDQLAAPPFLFSLFYSNYNDRSEENITRVSGYAYDMWQVADSLQLTAGLTYDHLTFPNNQELTPFGHEEKTRGQLSPKAGLIWTPWKDGVVRAAYTRSLGGVFFDNSFRLEPTTVAGFNQTYRSLIPESYLGNVPGTRFETFSLGMEQKLPTKTYVTLAGEVLNSTGTRSFGAYYRTNSVFVGREAKAFNIDSQVRFQERSLIASVNQLVGDNLAFGARYRLTDADFHSRESRTPDTARRTTDDEATLHQLNLNALLNLRCGFFSQLEGVWTMQDNRGETAPLSDENFWQLNAYVGYRFVRRHAEARVGVLNITDEDYRLNPLTLYNELPRERMLYASFKFYF